MGCKSVKNLEVSKEEYVAKLVAEINEDGNEKIRAIVMLGKIEVNEFLIEVNKIFFNPLAYALFKGSPKSFVSIHQDLGASLSLMERLLVSQSIFPLHLVSQRGNLELFTYYVEHTDLDFSLKGPDFSGVGTERAFDKVYNKYSFNCVQLLCEYGYLHMLAHVARQQVVSNSQTPYEFDTEVQNETTGETCALIACRHGNYILIKFLNSQKADFNKKNILGENALQILCSANRKKPLKELYECFVFLINSASVDVRYEYEETLLLIDDERLVEVFEEKLAGVGIFTKKRDVEEGMGSRMMDNHMDEEEKDVKKIRFGTFISQLNENV